VLHVSCDCKDRRKLQGFLYAQVFDEVVTKLGLLVPQDGRKIKQNQLPHLENKRQAEKILFALSQS
jgi:hypothetical protein